MYAKIENGILVKAPHPLRIGGLDVYHPTDATYIEAGYRPVKETEPPAEDGKYYTAVYREQNGQILEEWVESDPPTFGEGSANLDNTLTKPGHAADAEAVGKRLISVETRVSDLLFLPIQITNFTNTVEVAEMGAAVSSVTLNWETNKPPTMLTLDGTAMNAELIGKAFTGLNITSNKTWTLVATDEKGSDSQSTSVTFLNGIYWGAAAQPSVPDSAFVLGLANKKLTPGKVPLITVDAGSGQHIWYCLPARMGTCAFRVGGFEGGFELAGTIDLTNAFGYTEAYRIYRSAQTNLGNTTAEVN